MISFGFTYEELKQSIRIRITDHAYEFRIYL